MKPYERMGEMIQFIKNLFCKHKDLEFVRNIYGDEINAMNGQRSIWYCSDCRKFIPKDELVDA